MGGRGVWEGEIEGLKKYKLLSQSNDVVFAACEISTLERGIIE